MRARYRLALLLLEGYLYLGFIVLVFVAVIGLLAWGLATRNVAIALVSVFIGVPLLTTTAVALRALFFRVPPLEGVEIGRAEAPALHATVEAIRRQLRAPRVHRILIGPDANATAHQVPRLFLFRPRNFLRIGYPLLIALTPEQLRAVIAHELGHFSRAHGRFSVLVYRTRLSWQRLVEALHVRGTAPVWVYWLARRYVPRLQSYSDAAAREHELLADRCAAQVAGARATADALVHCAIVARFLRETYTPEFLRNRMDAPFGSLEASMRQTPQPTGDQLPEVLREDGYVDSAYPSLIERLAQLGETARVPERGDASAGRLYLGDAWASLAGRMDREWLRLRGDAWKADAESLRVRQDRLTELTTIETPSADELLERAHLLAELEGDDAALPVFRSAQEAGSAAAGLALGAILLEREDADGVTLIEQAVSADPSLVPEAAGALVPFLEGRGRLHDAQRWRTRATRHATHASLAAAERNALSALDRFLPHDLSNEDTAPLVEALNGSGIVRAFLVRRAFRYSSGEELLLVVVSEGKVDGDLSALAGRGPRIVNLSAKRRDVLALLESVPAASIRDGRLSSTGSG